MRIKNRIPLAKSQEKITYEDGSKAVRCYSPNNPHYFKNSEGNYEPIELDYKEERLLNIDACEIKDRNVFSVGVRKADNPEKFLGIRPSDKSNQQLEFTIEEIEFDNVPASRIDLSRTDKLDKLTTNLGDILIRSNRQGTKQLIRTGTAEYDFKIKYKIHLTDLQFQNRKKKYTDEILRSVPTRDIKHLGNIDTKEEYQDYLAKLTTISVGDNIVQSSFVKTDVVIVGDGTDTSKMSKDWMLIDSPQSFGAESDTFCMTYYLKDSFNVDILNYSLTRAKIEEMYITFLEGITHKNVSIDEANILLDGVIVGHCVRWDIKPGMKNTSFIASIKESSDTDILRAWQYYFILKYEEHLDKATEFKLNGEYYEPDKYGRFTIADSEGIFVFGIDKPKLLDENFNITSTNTLHTLRDNRDGTFEYIKYPDIRCIASQEVRKAFYIDADVYYSTTSDGWVQGAIRTNIAGSSVNSSDSMSQWAITVWSDGSNSAIMRTFLYFDTSSIENEISSCNLITQGYQDIARTASTVCIQEGTQSDTLTTWDYAAFTGDTFGSTAWTNTGTNTIEFEETGITTINKNGITKLCLRDLTYDVNNVIAYSNEGMYYSDNTGIDYDPYLEIVEVIPYTDGKQRFVAPNADHYFRSNPIQNTFTEQQIEYYFEGPKIQNIFIAPNITISSETKE